MGLTLSAGIKDEIIETKRPSSPVSTPQMRRLNIDPRSPSTDIARTPIEVSRTPIPNEITPRLRDERIVADDLDPRSPTTEFYRTPIVLHSEEPGDDIRNKHLDKVKRAASLTPAKSPRLLETRIVTQVENKRNSFVGLLETNIDYVETDLDNVAQIPEDLEEGDCKEKLSFVEELIEIKDAEELELSIDKCVEELDKKLTDLIHEEKEFCIKTLPKAKDNRTPLGDRHVNHRYQKVVPVLKVNDKPTRLPKNMSRIPIFKEKHVNGRHVQCENTPPRMVTNRSHWSTEDSLII